MSGFTWCFTWSDLDTGHLLKLIDDKFLEEEPYLKGIIENGSVLSVIRITSEHGSNDTLVRTSTGQEFTIKRGQLDYFYHKY